MSELLPCYCHGDDFVPYCPRHTPLPGEENIAPASTSGGSAALQENPQGEGRND